MKQKFYTILSYTLEVISLVFEIPGFILTSIGLFISDLAYDLKHLS